MSLPLRRSASRRHSDHSRRVPRAAACSRPHAGPARKGHPRPVPRCLHRRSQLHDLARPRPHRHPGLHPAVASDDHLAAQRQTGLSRAAVRRCLYTLTKLGFAGAEDGSRYSLRPRMLTLSHTYTRSNTLSTAAQPILERMSAAHPRVLLRRHPRRRRDRLHRPHHRQPRHGRRPPHRQPSARLLHQHGPRPACVPALRAARAVPRPRQPHPPHHPHRHLHREASPHPPQRPPQRLRARRPGATRSASAHSLCPSTLPQAASSPPSTSAATRRDISVLEMQSRFLTPLRNAASELGVYLR